MTDTLPVENTSSGRRWNLPLECPGTYNFCGISVKTKRQSHKNHAYSVQDKNILAMIKIGAQNIGIMRKLNCP